MTGSAPQAGRRAGWQRAASGKKRRLRAELLASAPRLPDADQSAYGLWPDVRLSGSGAFRSGRDVAFDARAAAAPRMTVPHILPSTLMTASASATLSLSRLNPTPHQIAVYASQSPSPTPAQHSLPGGSLHPSRELDPENETVG